MKKNSQYLIFDGSSWYKRVGYLEEYSKYSKIKSVEGVMKNKALTGCTGPAGSDLQDGGVPSEH